MFPGTDGSFLCFALSENSLGYGIAYFRKVFYSEKMKGLKKCEVWEIL